MPTVRVLPHEINDLLLLDALLGAAARSGAEYAAATIASAAVSASRAEIALFLPFIHFLLELVLQTL